MQTSVGLNHARSNISLADAVELLATSLGSIPEARQVLVQRAQIGELQGIASKAYGPFDTHFLDERDFPIPSPLWRRLGQHSDAEWRRGDLTASADTDRYAELRDDYGTPLRMIGVQIDIETLDRVLSTLPVEWATAHHAINLLIPMFGKGRKLTARKALAKRAHCGLVKTRARLFKWEVPKGAAFGGSQKIEREALFAPIPKRFWWAEGHEALEQNWVTGDFSTWIDKTSHWQAFGTEFSTQDVLAMLPADSRTTADDNEREASLGFEDTSLEAAGANAQAESTKTGRGAAKCGRTPGSGSLTRADAPLLAEMQSLMAEGRAFSAHGAAQKVAERASGAGTLESKAARLAKAFRLMEKNGAA